jgi:hypothetical protein
MPEGEKKRRVRKGKKKSSSPKTEKVQWSEDNWKAKIFHLYNEKKTSFHKLSSNSSLHHHKDVELILSLHAALAAMVDSKRDKGDDEHEIHAFYEASADVPKNFHEAMKYIEEQWDHEEWKERLEEKFGKFKIPEVKLYNHRNVMNAMSQIIAQLFKIVYVHEYSAEFNELQDKIYKDTKELRKAYHRIPKDDRETRRERNSVYFREAREAHGKPHSMAASKMGSKASGSKSTVKSAPSTSDSGRFKKFEYM